MQHFLSFLVEIVLLLKVKTSIINKINFISVVIMFHFWSFSCLHSFEKFIFHRIIHEDRSSATIMTPRK